MSGKIHFSSIHSLRSCKTRTSNEVKSKIWNTKKASDTDEILAKHFKLTSNFLSTSLAIAINNGLALPKFPGIAKIATVVSIDKKDVKYDLSKF